MRASMSRFGGRLSAFGKDIAEKAEKAAEAAAAEAREAAAKVEEKIREARRNSNASSVDSAAAAAAAVAAGATKPDAAGGGAGGPGAPEFTIGDDDDVFGETMEEAEARRTARRPSDPAREAAALAQLRLAGLSKGDETPTNAWGDMVQLFAATKEKRLEGFSTTSLAPRYLALSKDRLLVLQAHDVKLDTAIVKSNHHLTEIAKLTFSKKDKNKLSLYYRKGAMPDDPELAPSPFVKRVYHVEQAAEFVKGVQTALKAMG